MKDLVFMFKDMERKNYHNRFNNSKIKQKRKKRMKK